MSLTLFSINIEADLHLKNITKYLKINQPDVVFLQEVYKIHAEDWGRQFGYHVSFVPHVNFNIYEHIFKPLGEWGIATLTKIKPTEIKVAYYSKSPVIIPHEFMKTKKHPRSLLVTKLVDDKGDGYVFANTHFTWAMPDKADVEQAADFARLKVILEPYPSLVMSGDFNAPRESMVFRELATKYRSWVPEDVDTTLDPTYFRKPDLKLVVDHLFSTSDYKIVDVEVITGLSDHCGIKANINKY